MKAYKKFYVWTMNAKLFMSIYFVAVVFVAGLLIALTGGDSIKLLTLIEILAMCAIMAVLQCVLLNEKTDYTKGVFFGRSCIWLVISAALSVGTSMLFRWFDGLPSWCPWALGLFMMVGLSASLCGLKFAQDIETEKLNSDQCRYQNKQ